MASRAFAPANDGGDAVLNWDEAGITDLLPYSIGYRQAAEAIWVELGPRVSRGQFAEFEVCPPIYMLRHSIELGLKNAVLHVRAADRLQGGSTPDDDLVLSRHRLKPLWDDLLPRIPRVGADRACPTSANLLQHADLISQIELIDPDSYVFRYPITKNAALSLGQHFRFSPSATVVALVGLAATLENFGHEVGDWLDQVLDAYVAQHGHPTEGILPRLKLPPK